VVNKIDVLEKVNVFKLISIGEERTFVDKDSFKEYLKKVMMRNCPMIREVIFSESFDKI
jgi:hypothetical protein